MRTVVRSWIPIIVGLALALVFAPYSFFEGSNRLKNAQELVEKGKPTTARVVEARTAKRSGRLVYAFEVGGRTYEQTVVIAKDEVGQYPVNKEVPVTYLPANPEVSHMDPHKMQDSGRALRLYGPLIGLILGPILVIVGLLRLRS
jgi:hypothetical protein